MNLVTYYYETHMSHGTFLAKNDEEALARVPFFPGMMCLYREDQESRDGTPFKMLYDHKEID